ncbi:hypothetical protein [Enterobacter cloacae]|uniref:hypothetical protein n=1 Tax=Enterobacter cloacae TaxID=550 RepID=UPI0028741F29|nr:hypothetical protein [Enterobacter cloacae]MDS0065182.1 hypothetical protein [Enterobacter cloacae subsp. cloacae]MDS0107868.1 hypothetical protein [Enterobacter cloacae subsp. cloacae]MDW8497702.1 hypothetical protein [Enterobacter cloacae subsp. cloacae]
MADEKEIVEQQEEVDTQQENSAEQEGKAGNKKGAKASKAGKPDSYVIGCKLPCGLKIGQGSGAVVLKGANDSMLINGFGITKNVPADVWEEFEKNHKSSPLFLNGIIFAVTDMKSVEDASLERSRQKTGFEQVNAKDAGVEEDKEE